MYNYCLPIKNYNKIRTLVYKAETEYPSASQTRFVSRRENRGATLVQVKPQNIQNESQSIFYHSRNILSYPVLKKQMQV